MPSPTSATAVRVMEPARRDRRALPIFAAQPAPLPAPGRAVRYDTRRPCLGSRPRPSKECKVHLETGDEHQQELAQVRRELHDGQVLPEEPVGGGPITTLLNSDSRQEGGGPGAPPMEPRE